MATDKPFLSFVVEPELLARLDDYRFKQRFPSRAAAIKFLLDWALPQDPDPADQKTAAPGGRAESGLGRAARKPTKGAG